MIDKPILLFGGKGGVGKTTCSASVAAYLASTGQRTIIVTSDMTPSLSDIFEQQIGDQVTTIGKDLDAIEISQDSIVARWKERFSQDFYDILSQLVDVDALDSESRHQLLDYIGSAPSLREETMLDLVVDLVESGNYDRVIWDTAPSGETLNLLNMPRFIRRHLKAGARVFEELDKIGKKLINRRSIADTMDEWIQLSEKISRFVQDRTTFIIVANPEGLVVRHVERLLRTLKDYSIAIRGMVINCVTRGHGPEYADAVLSTETRYVRELTDLAGGMPVAMLPTVMPELRGIEALRETGKILVRGLQL